MPTSDVIIDGKFEIKNKSKEIDALQKEIKKLEAQKLPLEAQMEAFNQKAGNARKRVAELKKELASVPKLTAEQMQESMKSDKFFTLNGENIAKEIAESKKEMQKFSDEADKAGEKIELLNSQISILKDKATSMKFTGVSDNSMAEVGVQAKANLESAAKAAGNMSSQLGQAKAQADNLGKSVGKVDSEAGKSSSGIKGRFTSALKSAESAFGSFGKRISSTLKSAFIFSVLYKGLNELKARMSAMLSTNQQFTSSLNQVKSNLAVAFQPIYQVAMPAINALLQLLVKATAYIAAFTNALFGTSLGASVSAAREMERSIQAVQSGASGATAAEKQLTAAIKEKQNQVKALQRENKALQREYEQQKKAIEAQTKALEGQIKTLESEIDAIQRAEDAANKAAQAQREMIQANIEVLQDRIEANNKASQAAQKAIDSQIKSLQTQQKSLDRQYNSETKAIDNRIKALQNEIKTIQKAQKAAQEAARANEKFTADFDELSTLGSPEEADPYDAEIEKIQEKIDALQEEKEVMAELYEAQRETIQLNIDALQEEKAAIAERYDMQNEKIQEQIDMLQKAQDAIKDADYSSAIDMYQSKIDAIRQKIDELNDSLEENPQIEQNELLIEKLQEEIDLLQEQKDALQAASDTAGGFDSSGITKFNDQLEALKKKIEESPLYKWIVDNKEKIGEFIELFVTLTAEVGAAYGAFKLLSTIFKIASTPGGAIMIAIAAIATLITFFGDAEAAMDALKKVFDGFTEFLQGVFSGDIEMALDGIDKMFEGSKDFIIEVINAVDNALQTLADKIVDFIFKLQDVWYWYDTKFKPELNSNYKTSGYDYGGGGNYDYFAPTSLYSETKIPALATGAVLPPNKPFMAWVGDQKNGTNIEAPLSTIEEALRNVMAEQQYNFNITADGSMGALIRMLNLHISREDSRKTAF